jgi:hypothetical protein
MTTSAIITATVAHGGPPLHRYDTEEHRVLTAGHMEYRIGDQTLHVEGPCVIRIPAALPDTFVNRGGSPARLVCFFPAYNCWSIYEALGPNPLLEPQ